ncbi:MAG: hypothetical protein IPN32_31765 [Deltaproteobacteria bacterium]|nr:hypothetical protein [Deltaproteobacteria bacterium]
MIPAWLQEPIAYALLAGSVAWLLRRWLRPSRGRCEGCGPRPRSARRGLPIVS